MASREIALLSPAMQILHNKFMDRCRRDTWLLKNGITILVTCTYRSNEEQAKLYAQGRALPGPIVTKAKPGQSKHNAVANGKPAAEAFDIVPLWNGKPLWSATVDDPKTEPDDVLVWQRVGQHGMDVGLEWFGAEGSPFKEYAHFQNPAA